MIDSFRRHKPPPWSLGNVVRRNWSSRRVAHATLRDEIYFRKRPARVKRNDGNTVEGKTNFRRFVLRISSNNTSCRKNCVDERQETELLSLSTQVTSGSNCSTIGDLILSIRDAIYWDTQLPFWIILFDNAWTFGNRFKNKTSKLIFSVAENFATDIYMKD